jgi:hypothetical protein
MMDYSTIDKDIKEKIAERDAMAVLTIETVAMTVNETYLINLLADVRQDLAQLVKDLGGHPAIP